jgi:hypothetical protein
MGEKYKLSPRDVLDVRALLASGQSYEKISRLFNVNMGTISPIVHGKSYAHIQTEEDLYKWHVEGGEQRKFACPPAIHKIYDSYCGFKLTSYGLRRYGRKNISVILDTIKICEHGDLCEECCFIYSGPEKADEYNFITLPIKLIKHGGITLDTFISNITFNYYFGDAEMVCQNRYCANAAHLTYAKKRKYGRSGQKIARDH